VPTNETSLSNLPEDKQALQAMLRALWHEREQQKQRIDDLYLENLQLQKELLRYKKATYGPRADRLSENELAQALLEFAEELEQKPSDKPRLLLCNHFLRHCSDSPSSAPEFALVELGLMPSLERVLSVVVEIREKYKPEIEEARQRKSVRRRQA
jgi:hypothetical protein